MSEETEGTDFTKSHMVLGTDYTDYTDFEALFGLVPCNPCNPCPKICAVTISYSVGSAIAAKMGVKIVIGGDSFAEYSLSSHQKYVLTLKMVRVCI